MKVVREMFPTIIAEPIAARGERLVLCRTRLVSPDGLELSLLSVSECDATGRFARTVTFDDTDLAGALNELDERSRVQAGD
jgi:hypothetical protein